MNGVQIRIRGKVQGVGFRPFVWQLARAQARCGDVCNDGDGVLVRELTVDAWDGKTLNELALPTKHRVIALALRGKGGQHYHFVPAPDQPLSSGDRMVVLGQIEHVLKLNP